MMKSARNSSAGGTARPSCLAVAILVTHLGLLFWELRFVSASLAYPGLAPTAPKEAPSE